MIFLQVVHLEEGDEWECNLMMVGYGMALAIAIGECPSVFFPMLVGGLNVE